MRLRMVFQHKASVEQESLGVPPRSILVVSLALLPSIYIQGTRSREAAKRLFFSESEPILGGTLVSLPRCFSYFCYSYNISF